MSLSYRAYRSSGYTTSILRGVWTPSSRIAQHALVWVSIVIPFYGLRSARVTYDAAGSILTNRWKLAALACVRDLGTMDPVYPKEKDWGLEDGTERWRA